MSEKIMGIGIAGCGTISDIHAEAVKNTKHGKLVAAYSRNGEKLKSFCGKHGGQGYTDYSSFLSRKDLDVVVICTPSGTHLDFGISAAEAGKHIIVEKPIEISLERGRRLIESCNKNKVKLAVIYQNRFIEAVTRMKQVVTDGTLGRIFRAGASVKWFRDQTYYNSAPWRGTFDLDGGGVLINQAIHTIDLLTWFAGDIESLFAIKGTFTHSGIEGEDNVVAALQFSSGALGVLEASTSMVPPQPRIVEINGEYGTALLEGNEFRLLQSESDLTKSTNNKEASGASSPLAGFGENHHKKQYDHILESIINDEEPVVSGEESLKSLAVVEAVYASANKGKPVKMKKFIAGEEYHV